MLKNITAILSKYFSNLYYRKCQFNYFIIDFNQIIYSLFKIKCTDLNFILYAIVYIIS